METPRRFFHHGPWTAELRGDELACISFRETPVLRAVRAVVRDHNWNTLIPEVTSARTEEHQDQTTIVLETTWSNGHTPYRGTTTVALDHEGVSVSFRGTATENFAANRIGLVVLHRPDDAGRPVAITTPSGRTAMSSFPTHISPHQPFMDIRAMAWERDNTAFHLHFAGDVFETEDQRNWTDASFKTYSTPLSRPFPVTHAPFDEVRQTIRLNARRVIRIIAKEAGTVPQLGTAASPPSSYAPPADRRERRGLGPLLVEVAVHPKTSAATVSIEETAALAELWDAGLDLRIVAEKPEDVARILGRVPLGCVKRLAVYDASAHVTQPHLWDALVSESREHGYRGELLAGARSHFTELNRNRSSAEPDAAGLTYSITPQMHAVEPEAMIDTIPIQALTAAQAVGIADQRPVHVGPVTLAPRFNAVATDEPDENHAAADDRAGTDFAAAWTLGSIASLTSSGVTSASYGTLGDLKNPEGILLQKLANLSGNYVLATEGKCGCTVYPVNHSGGTTVYAGNLSSLPAYIRVTQPGGNTTDLELQPWQVTSFSYPC